MTKQGSDKVKNSTSAATSPGVPTLSDAIPLISSASRLAITGFFALSVLIKPGHIALIKIFGPSIFKVKIPDDLVNNLNKFIDNVIKDEEQSKKLDVGRGLVGDVKQEFRLDRKT